MFGLGMPELIIIFLIILLLFGAKNLPDIARNLGKSIKTFKKGMEEPDDNKETTRHDQTDKDAS